MVFIGYGSLIGLALSKAENPGVKKLGAITSGIGLTLLLVAGFGLIAKLGYSYTSTWIIVKSGSYDYLAPIRRLSRFHQSKARMGKTPVVDHPLTQAIIHKP